MDEDIKAATAIRVGSYIKIANVIEVDAPAPHKEPTGSKATLSQRMVKGSKWKLTEPAQVMKEKSPVITNGVWSHYDAVPDYVLPAGTEFTVSGKFQKSGPGFVSGNWVPIIVSGSKTQILVEFKELNKEPEQVGEAEIVPMFAIWDKDKKQYYAGADGAKYDYSSGRGYELRELAGVNYSDKLTKAKKFKRLADVRVHALIQSGYYDDLPDSYGSVPEWMICGKQIDIPDSWEIVKLDKLTKKEVERIELVDTFKRSWKLRGLTVKYSSSVRKVYSDLEKKDKLDEWSAIMMFKKPQRNNYWTDELSDEQIEDINKLLGRWDSSDVKIQKNQTGFAVAIKDAMTATMIRLAYTGDLECAIIDFTTMEEVLK